MAVAGIRLRRNDAVRFVDAAGLALAPGDMVDVETPHGLVPAVVVIAPDQIIAAATPAGLPAVVRRAGA